MITTIVTAMCLCVVEFLVIVIASPMAKPDLLLIFLPEDIGRKALGHTEPPKYKQIIAHVLLIVLGIIFLGAMVFLGLDGLKNGYGFWQLYGRFMVVFYTMKVFDILVQDQWLVMSTDFFKKIFPETSECEGWKVGA